jgi:UDP-N-acetylmuramate dehydrogenase
MDETQRIELVRIDGKGIRFDAPMNQYTTFRTGGKAEALYITRDLSFLQRTVSYLSKERIPYLVVGNGSNLLVRDGGLKGVAIVLRGNLATIEQSEEDDQIIQVGAGLSIGHLLSHCNKHGLVGLEFLAGIPGTVGGAVAMNAGAFGGDILGVIHEIQVVTGQGELCTMERSQLDFSYRQSSIPKETVIVRATFRLRSESAESVGQKVADYLARRKAKQPLEYPSGGSVFKNPPNDYAGRLIERAGLKGTRVGGAMISPKHANFIVNTGGARAEDILALIDLARDRVREETGIELEIEIRVVGV